MNLTQQVKSFFRKIYSPYENFSGLTDLLEEYKYKLIINRCLITFTELVVELVDLQEMIREVQFLQIHLLFPQASCDKECSGIGIRAFALFAGEQICI